MKYMSIKHILGNKVIFGPAFPLFLKLSTFFDYLNAVIKNKTFNGEVNGEYWFRDLFLDERVYLDVGFNQGEWSKYIAQKNRRAKIIAFDPCLDVVQKFEGEKEHFESIELIQMALSNANGEMTFYDYGNLNGCNSLAKRDIDFNDSVEPKIYTVAVTTLDEWLPHNKIDHVDFLKIDAEGFDLNVLEG
jgi:FkbM family methyltransferase